MTGWRIGYAAGMQTIIKAMTDLASHSTSNATTTAQYATVEAYNGPQDTVEDNASSIRISFRQKFIHS